MATHTGMFYNSNLNHRGGFPMLIVESEQEDDGRWIAEIAALPGVLAYGNSKAEADAKVKSLALRVIADRLDNGEQLPQEIARFFKAA
jgi:predicted RNase H-like HicB family nuclease